jgi:transposase-like protein
VVRQKGCFFLSQRLDLVLRQDRGEKLSCDIAFQKEAVMALVERGGRVASFHVPNVTAATLKPIIAEALSTDSHFRTDESGFYWEIGEQFASHHTVVHSANEYVRGDAHTNTIEGYFSILKRGIYGVYQHVSEHHLKRYLAEFDFRYNERIGLGIDDAERTTRTLRGIVGKRLTYRRPNEEISGMTPADSQQ